MDNIFHTVPTVAASLLGLTFAAIIWTFGQQKWPRVTAVLVVGGFGGLVATTAGRWIQHAITVAVNATGGAVGTLFGAGVTVVAVALALVLFGMVGFHFHHRKVGDKTLFAAAAFPWAVALVPGPIGVFLGFVVSLCAALVGALFTLLLNGIH